MAEFIIRDIQESDYNDIVDLNASEVQYTNVMDIDRVNYLDSLSTYHKVAVLNGRVVAFLLAMKDHCQYQNDNFNWFSLRYKEFLYIDRIVVGRSFQGHKIGSLLYEDVFNYAREEKITVITCEINIVPPNESSLAFHAKHGFREVGTQWIVNGQKQVSMQAAKP